MRVMHIEIPIHNYNGVFMQTLLFSEFPSKEKLLKVLADLHERDVQYPEYCGCWYKCILSVENAEEYPESWRARLMATNTFTNVADHGRHPLRFQLRDVH